MPIRCSCLLMGVSKSPVLLNRYIQPVFSRNALVLFNCVEQVKEADIWVLFIPRLRNLFSREQRHHSMNSWATDLAVEKKSGGGREVLRILTRPWSEDSSTPIRKSEKNRQRGTTKQQPKQTTTRQGQQHSRQPDKPNQMGEEGGQVLKNLTRPWPGSSSTQSTNKKEQIQTTGQEEKEQ